MAALFSKLELEQVCFWVTRGVSMVLELLPGGRWKNRTRRLEMPRRYAGRVAQAVRSIDPRLEVRIEPATTGNPNRVVKIVWKAAKPQKVKS